MILFNFCCLPIPVKLSRDLKKLPVFIQVPAWHFDHRKNIKLLIVISTMISNLRKICTCIPRNPAVSVRRNSVFYSKKKQVLHLLYSDLLDLDLNNERNERWLSRVVLSTNQTYSRQGQTLTWVLQRLCAHDAIMNNDPIWGTSFFFWGDFYSTWGSIETGAWTWTWTSQ